MTGKIEHIMVPVVGVWNPPSASDTAELESLLQQMKGLVADMTGLVRQISSLSAELTQIAHETNHCNQWDWFKEVAETVDDMAKTDKSPAAVKIQQAIKAFCPESREETLEEIVRRVIDEELGCKKGK